MNHPRVTVLPRSRDRCQAWWARWAWWPALSSPYADFDWRILTFYVLLANQRSKNNFFTSWVVCSGLCFLRALAFHSMINRLSPAPVMLTLQTCRKEKSWHLTQQKKTGCGETFLHGLCRDGRKGTVCALPAAHKCVSYSYRFVTSDCPLFPNVVSLEKSTELWVTARSTRRNNMLVQFISCPLCFNS